MNTPWIESPFFEKILSKKKFDNDFIEIAKSYNENGYVVLKNFITQEETQTVRLEMDKFYTEMSDNGEKKFNKLTDKWVTSEPIKELACKDELIKILNNLYDRMPIPFQTLNFKYGSQARAHSDSFHFNSLPAKFMCGVWIALEDITPDNGPVFYFPKSHKLPEYNYSHIFNEPLDTSDKQYEQYEDFMEERMVFSEFEKKPFYAKKGDVLIWSSNIVHGGMPVLNPNTTRYSQVTHYFFEDCIYYTPMFSNMVTKEYYLRNFLTNIKTGEAITHSYNGHQLNYFNTDKEKGLFILHKRFNLNSVELSTNEKLIKKGKNYVKKLLNM